MYPFLSTVQALYNVTMGSIEMDLDISGMCYKGTILQRNYKKMTIPWSFSYNSFAKLNGKKWKPQHNHVISNLCYNKVCYKEIGLL